MSSNNQSGVSSDPPTTVFPLREPTPGDGSGVHQLIAACPPLDVNSTYCYLLLCSHFAATSVVADGESGVVGFVSAYRKPQAPDTLFVWQVAVGSAARGQGLARRMIEEILCRPACREIRRLETTISPSNEPSKALFQSLARGWGANCETTVLFPPETFGKEQHEEEELYSIGPLDPHRK